MNNKVLTKDLKDNIETCNVPANSNFKKEN